MDMSSVRQAMPKSLTLTLTRPGPAGDWTAEAIHFTGGASRYHTRLAARAPMRQVFDRAFLRGIDPHLTLCDVPGVLSERQILINLPGLVLRGLSVFVHKMRGMVQTVTLSFARAIGDLQAVLTPRYRLSDSLADEQSRLAVRTLVDLVHPCLDILDHASRRLLDPAEQARVADRLTQLSEVREELGFYAGLLHRLAIQGDGAAPPGAPVTG